MKNRRAGHASKFFGNARGFTLIEVMIATVVICIGLVGAAAMQLTAIRGDNFSKNFSAGANTANSWAEWILTLSSMPNQPPLDYYSSGLQPKRNFVLLASLDQTQGASATPSDPLFTQLVLPRDITGIVNCINGVTPFTTTDGAQITVKFRKPPYGDADIFKAADLPPAPPPGAFMQWNIGTNIPGPQKVTVEVSIIYNNAFMNTLGPRLRFVLSS